MKTYIKPEIADYGDLEELTANCFGSGDLDELGKTFNVNARTQPLGGDPGFCAPGP
jgi:hypothetical protein